MNTVTQPDYPSTAWVDDLLVRICVGLQLTKTQYEAAVQHYTAVGEWLGAVESPLARHRPKIFPQGSLRIGTTVRPLGREEYDLDLVCRLDIAETTDPVAVLRAVERRLRENGVLEPKIQVKNRCVRVKYAGQFHLDILPARPDRRLGGTCLQVPDRELHDWKESNPQGYATWFEDRCTSYLERARRVAASVQPLPAPEGADEKEPLQLAVQLLKRWRDVRYARQPEIAPISIVLTTLSGTHYSGQVNPLQALVSVVTRIRAAIPSNGRLVVLNPANPLEDLSERWDNEPLAYRAFVQGINELDNQLAQLSRAQGIESLKRQLGVLFGPDTAASAVRQQGQAVAAARANHRLSVSAVEGALTTAPATSSVPIRGHTFYGE